MSYCVNCGVELEKACKACPLCDTPVINPREKSMDNEIPAYPTNLSIPKSTNKPYLCFVLSLIILIPSLVLIILNTVFFGNPVLKYIIGGFVVAWVWFLFPLLWKKPIPAVTVFFDAFTLMAYFWFYRFCGDDTGWVYGIAFPTVICLWAIANLFLFWKRKPRSKSAISVAVLGAINVMTFVIEMTMSVFFLKKLQIVISLVMTACCVSLMIFFIVLEKSKRMKAWVQRKFFI
ncbi:MAG: hypothetical protein IKB88_11130 [Clostridia bacterium]|nr:hypothetical protein [Clostridia bacterium]